MSSKNAKTLHVKFTRKIGGDELELNVSVISEPEDIKHNLNSMFDVVKLGIEEFNQNFAPALGNAAKAGYEVDETWYPVERLSVTIDKGKRYVKAHGGKWTDHGIVIWPEVAKLIGFNLSLVPVEGYTPEKALFMKIGTDKNKNTVRIMSLRIGA